MALYKIDEGPILLLGEGDFSFSVTLQPKIPSLRIVSSSYLTEDEVKEVHKNASGNISLLKENGVEVLHGIDATKLQESVLKEECFKRIIFNFPHIGGKSNIKKNRELLKNFFPSALTVLADGGDVCVTLAQGQGGTPCDTSPRQWHDTWQVVAAAAYCDLVLSDTQPFNVADYETYSSTGFRSRDQHFYTKGALTYIFTRNTPVLEPSPGPLDISKVEKKLCSQSILVDRHLDKKLDRNLLSTPHHPLSLTAECFQFNFEGQRSGLQLSSENFKDISDKLPTLMPPSVCNKKHRYSCGMGDQDVSLRTSLVESFAAFTEKEGSLVEDNCMHLARGEVFRKVGLDSELAPMQHEYCVFAQESETITSRSFAEAVESALEWTVLNTKHCTSKSEAPEYIKDIVCDLKSFEISYQSENQFYEVACNQVEAKGPAELKKNIPKKKDYTAVVGYIGKLTKTDSDSLNEHVSKKMKPDSPAVLFCCLNLDLMAQMRYDIPDQRVLCSENPSFLSQFEPLHFSETKRFSPLSLFPPLWRHDVSLWENGGDGDGDGSEFDVQRLCDVVADVTRGIVRRVMCVNVWAEPQEGRVSRCYRLLYQSNDVAVSHARAHAFQNAVRLTIAQEMGVELR